MNVLKTMLLALLYCAAVLNATETQPLKLVAAQRVSPEQISVTGRVIPLLSARLGARVTGLMKELGRTPTGTWIDVGVPVKAGQELFKIEERTFQLGVEAARATLIQAQAVLADVQAGQRPEQRDALKAAIDEIDAQLEELQRDELRYQELIKVDGAASQKQLETVHFRRKEAIARRAAALARYKEAQAGPTPTAVAVAEARVAQTQAALNISLQDLQDTSIKAPYDGIITRRFKGPGDYLLHMPFTEVMELVSLDFLVAELRLPEAYFSRVAAGQTRAILRSPLLKENLTLTITRVIPAVDPLQGSFGVWIQLPAGGHGLTPGAFLQGDLQLAESADWALVPRQAVLTQQGKNLVYLAENGRMQQRQVELGDRLTESVVLKSGVAPGQKVVLGPAESLIDGAPLPAELLNN